MLEPEARSALTELLRPPTGFELLHGVGTTFTLDLETALAIPLSFAAHRVSIADGDLGVIEALRRAADKIDIFTQAGAMSMSTPSDLVVFLEQMVHPVTQNAGIFHPKVWFLEYGRGDERRYRFICASRNLTADRSWDAVVQLDGVAAPADSADQQAAAASVNAPLVGLLRGLPQRSVQPVTAEREARLDGLADRIGTVVWEKPAGVKTLAFHVFGEADSTPLRISGKQILVISPFVSDDGLMRLAPGSKSTVHLISRDESIDRLTSAPARLGDRLTTSVLDSAATFDDAAPDAPAHDDSADTAARRSTAREKLVGLHAKVIVTDSPDFRDAHVYIGSANATDAAQSRNVEVMVELTGSRAVFGVDATVKALGALIGTYEAQTPSDDSDEKAERKIEAYLRSLATIRLTVRVTHDVDYQLDVWADQAVPEIDGMTLSWSLLTVPTAGATGIAVGADAATRLSGLALTDITPFIMLSASDGTFERRTIVLAELLDDDTTRRDAVMARKLDNDPQAFIQLLTLMLELSGVGVGAGAGVGGHGFFGTAGAADVSARGLFEALVRAVGAGAGGLDDAKRLIDVLRTRDDVDVLPPGFDELWGEIWKAHEALVGTRGATHDREVSA